MSIIMCAGSPVRPNDERNPCRVQASFKDMKLNMKKVKGADFKIVSLHSRAAD